MLKIIKRHFSILAFIIIAAISVLTYLPSFNSSFHLDDYESIESSNIKVASPYEIIKRYPTRWLVFLTFQANAKVHDYNVFGYHVVNLTIHIFCSFLFYSLLRLIWRPLRRKYPLALKKFSPKLTPLFAGALFAVHPLQSQAVIYISQRLALSSTLFLLLALTSVARGFLFGHSKIRGWFVAAASIFLGFFCKETIVVAPLIIASFLLIFYPPDLRKWSLLKWMVTSILTLIFLLSPVIILFNLSNWDVDTLLNNLNSIGGKIDIHTPGMTRYSYAITQFSIILKYVYLFIFPRGLNIDHSISLSTTFFSLQVLCPFFLLILFIVLSWLKRQTLPLLFFGIIIFLLGVLPQSSLIPTPDLMFEHRTYLSNAGLILILISLFSFIKRKIIIRVLAIILIIILSVVTFERSKVWESELSLWSDAYAKSPAKLRVINNYANSLINTGELLPAARILEKTMKTEEYIFPSFFGLLGNIYVRVGEYDKAAEVYLKGLKNDWTNLSLRYNLAVILQMLKKNKQAEHHFKRALYFHPYDPDSRLMLGILYADDLKKYSKATNQFVRFLELFPEDDNSEFVKVKLNKMTNTVLKTK